MTLKKITPLLLSAALVSAAPLYAHLSTTALAKQKTQTNKQKTKNSKTKTKAGKTTAPADKQSAAADTLFIYSPGESQGARLALVSDGKGTETGQIFSSDYSQWGAEKRMHNLFVMALPTGGYAAVFGVNDHAPCFAVAFSDNLTTWRPQDYPYMAGKGGCLAPVIKYEGDGHYAVLYKTKDGQVCKTTTDGQFRHFSTPYAASPKEYEEATGTAVTMAVNGKEQTGQIFVASHQQADSIKTYFAQQGEDWRRSNENMKDDANRFAWLTEDSNGAKAKGFAEATLTVDGTQRKAISDKLIGIFFEDISYAADGGLYAEMVQNRDFEYSSADRHDWNSSTAWTTSAPDGKLNIHTEEALSLNNPHYAVLTSDTISNGGWDGMVLHQGESYRFSFRVKNIEQKSKNFTVALMDGGRTLASAKLKTKGKHNEWKEYTATLTPDADATKARLVIIPEKNNPVAVDMISLFPTNTFKGRKNGLRKDLAETLAALKPKFVRFPGGCMSHGDGLDNIYHWQETIGPLEDRKPQRNIWSYHQTRGLGFYEFFQFCEDIGAEPLPVLAAGVPCQNSSADNKGYGGQQGGIAMQDMPEYIDELLHLIEWANGDPATSEWAQKRAEAGHPAPFNLKYLGIGNEDLISTAFEERYEMIARAVKERYPEITVCGTVGPFHAPSSDYVEGWKFANQHPDLCDMVDEHYYESTGWLLNHQHYYDNYSRQGSKVYLGEWAAKQGKGGVGCALAEAAYLCHIERNADVVEMTSYAPLLSNNKHSNWQPDMIYFDNEKIEPSASYETQRLFSVYSGNEYVSSKLEADSRLTNRIAASVVTDTKTGKTYLRLVNVLPTELHLTLGLRNIRLSGNAILMHGFSGQPEDTKAEKHEVSLPIPADGKLQIILKPYSMQVLEL